MIDQTEMQSQCERYRLATAKARADIEAITGDRISAPALSQDDLFQNFEILKQHAIELTAKMREIASSYKTAPHDAVAAEEKALQEEITQLNAEIVELNAETAAIKLEIAALERETAQIIIERDEWKAKADPTSIQKQLAAAICEHGIRHSGRALQARPKIAAGQKIQNRQRGPIPGSRGESID